MRMINLYINLQRWIWLNNCFAKSLRSYAGSGKGKQLAYLKGWEIYFWVSGKGKGSLIVLFDCGMYCSVLLLVTVAAVFGRVNLFILKS